MAASTREEIVEIFTALDTVVDRVCDVSLDVFTTPEHLRAIERLEQVTRRLRTPQHALINHLKAQAGEEELGAKLPTALAERLRISKPDTREAAEKDLAGKARDFRPDEVSAYPPTN